MLWSFWATKFPLRLNVEHRRFLPLLSFLVLAAFTLPMFGQTPDIAHPAPTGITHARPTSQCQIAAQGCAGKPSLEQISFHRLPGVTPRLGPSLPASTQHGAASHTYGAFWEVGEGFTTTLFLRNKDTQNSVMVNVVLFSHDGGEQQRTPLEVAANSVSRLDFSEVVRPDGDAARWGSMMIEF